MKNAWIATIVALIMAAGGSYALYLQLRSDPLPEQLLYGNGHIEGTEVRVSAEVSGRVVENFLVEGRAVKAQSVLVRIDRTRLELQRDQAKSEIAAIQLERRQVEEELGTWRHHLQVAARDHERYSQLEDKAVVSSQKLEVAESKLMEARGRVGALEAKIKAITSRLEAATTTVRLIELDLTKSTVLAPIDGTILVKAVEQGEFLPVGGTIGVLVDLSRLELKVFIRERDIGKVHLSDQARVRVDAFQDRYFEGTVIRVDQKAQFTPREIHMPEERTRMVFGVTLRVENPDGVLKPGMPADSWILWKKGGQWPDSLHVPQ